MDELKRSFVQVHVGKAMDGKIWTKYTGELTPGDFILVPEELDIEIKEP